MFARLLILCSLLLAGVSGFFPQAALGIVFYERPPGDDGRNLWGEPHMEGKAVQIFPLNGRWRWQRGEDGGSVSVPGCYLGEDGIIFHRYFDLPSQWQDRHLKLVALGINYRCSISLNGVYLAAHEGGYVSFSVDLAPEFLNFGGTNEIEIKVDNELDPRYTIPPRSQIWGWRNYGGIFRDIYLLSTPRTFVDGARLRSTLEEDLRRGTLGVEIRFKSFTTTPPGVSPPPGSRFSYVLEIRRGEGGRLVARTPKRPLEFGSKQVLRKKEEIEIKNPDLWNPGDPRLYRLEIFLFQEKELVDRYRIHFGMKDLRIVDGDFVLNGDWLVLRGLLYHEEAPGMGSALSFDRMEKDVITLKETGANMVRLAYPPHPVFLDYCDRYGLLVLEEIPLRQFPPSLLAAEAIKSLARRYLKGMILRDRHHPSVLGWGLAAGLASPDERSREFLEALVPLARELDDRPLFYGALWHSGDVCGEVLDFAVLELPSGDVEDMLSQRMTRFPSSPVVVSLLCRTLYREPLALLADTRFRGGQLGKLWGRINQIRGVDGELVAALKDWYGDQPLLVPPGGDPFLQPAGLITPEGTKKALFGTVQDLFSSHPGSVLPDQHPLEEFPAAFPVGGLLLVVLFILGYRKSTHFRGNLKRTFAHSHGFFVDVKGKRYLRLAPSLFLGLLICGAQAITLSGLFYRFRESQPLNYALVHLIGNGSLSSKIFRLIWKPPSSILAIFLVSAVFFLLLALVLRLAAFTFKAGLRFKQAVTFSIWSGASFLFLIPVTILFYRLISISSLFWPSVGLVLLLILWFVLRFQKGLRVIFGWSWLRVWVLSGVVVLILGFALGLYLGETRATLDYWGYFLGEIVR